MVNDQIRASGKGTLDLESLHIRSSSRGENGSPAFDGVSGANGGTPHPSGKGTTPGGGVERHNYGRFDASALHIAHALRATELQKAYKKDKPLHAYLVGKQLKNAILRDLQIFCCKNVECDFFEFLQPKEEQTELEMKFRKEEDILYRKFEKARKEEVSPASVGYKFLEIS